MQSRLKALRRASLPLRHIAGNTGGLNLVVAVDADDLLSNIVHAENVLAERRHIDLVALNLEAETFEYAAHIVGGHVDAEKPVDALGFETDDRLLLLAGVHIDHAGDNFTRAEQVDQLAGALQRAVGVLAIQSLFKSAGRLGAHTQLARGDADGRTVEAGGLEDDDLGCVGDL